MGRRGEAVQVDPIKRNLKPPGTKRLKLEYDGLVSNFGFKFSLRRYTEVEEGQLQQVAEEHLRRLPPSVPPTPIA